MTQPAQSQQRSYLEAIGQPAERTVTFEARARVDTEARTVELCFSTENPVERWYGFEILDHSPNAADLRRLNKGGPVLLCHDRHQQCGAVVPKTARIDDDKRGRATVLFSRSQLGTDTMNDVEDGIRTSVSVRYIPRRMQLEKADKEKGDTYRVTKWEALEISFEPIEADTQCGVGRGLEEGGDPAEDERSTGAPAPDPKPTEVRTAMVTPTENVTTPSPAVSEAVARAREIIELGELFGETELARTYATSEGATVEGYRAEARVRRQAAQAQTQPTPPAPQDAASRQGGGQQLARVIPRYGRLRNFHGEGAEERAYRFAQWFMAGPLGRKRAADFCREQGIPVVFSRAQEESVNEKGGFLVPEEFGNDLIDLREQFGVFRRNAKIVPMVSESRTDPRRTGGLTAYFVDEGEDGTESEKGWDRVGLRAKKLMVLGRYSSEISEDAAINMGDDLAGEIAYAFANKEDLCGFNGDGSSTYGGITGVREKLKGLSGTIANISGLKVGTGNAYSELTLADFRGVVALLPQYADTPMAKWFVHRTFYYDVMVGLLLAGGGVTAAEIEGQRTKRFLGYDVEFAQVMPKSEANSQVCALLGDLAKAASLGSRRDTTIAVSEHSRFRSDEIELKGTERVDINVHSVGNATATAADKEAGPVVGLITAAS